MKVVTCRACGRDSRLTYRCDGCGVNLAGRQVRSVGGQRLEDLIDVEVPVACTSCHTERELPLAFDDIGRCFRMGCPLCERVTRHRPVGEDLRLTALRLGFDAPKLSDTSDDADSDQEPAPRSESPRLIPTI